jgi:hypothetical protein
LQLCKINILRQAGLLFLLLSSSVYGQTGCAIEHTAPGAFICFPSPAANTSEASVTELFHLSAQGNAWNGHAITHYVVFLDKRIAYESKLTTPAQGVSIEVNVKSPFTSGFHSLSLVIDGAGTAEIKQLQFQRSTNPQFCEPVSSLPSSACTSSNSKAALTWFPARPPSKALDAWFPQTAADRSPDYPSYPDLYLRNLKSLEADTADAMIVDSRGSLYVVFHLSAGLELRKYSSDASIIYDAVIPTCGPGLLSVSGLAVDKAGRVWIAGMTTACLATTSGAWQARVHDTSLTHGFVILLNTSLPSSTAPRYATYLADIEMDVAAIRADSEGNAYVIGTTKSSAFPHDFSFKLNGRPNANRRERMSFVFVLNPSGSGLRWSALVDNAKLTALTIDSANNVFLTGRAASPRDDLVIAELSHSGRELSYAAYLGLSGNAEGRAISIAPNEKWIFVAGDTDSRDNPLASSSRKSEAGTIRPFLVAVQLCTKRLLFSRAVAGDDNSVGAEISRGPALDAFTSALPRDLAILPAVEQMRIDHKFFQITTTCLPEIR